MDIVKKISALTQQYPRPVVALGMFDGVHPDHARVIRHAVDKAHEIADDTSTPDTSADGTN